MEAIDNHLKSTNRLKYLVVSEQDMLWGLTISSVGYQHILPNSNYPPLNHPSGYLFSTEKGRTLDNYHLVYISKGGGTIFTETTKLQELTEGDIFLLYPGEWHTYKPNKLMGWDEHWIGFKGPDIESKINNNFFQKSKPVFRIGINDEIVKLYNDAINIAIEQKSGFQQMLAGITNHLLGLTYSLDKNLLYEDSQLSKQMNMAKIFMLENLFEDIKLEDIAKELNMSYSWFRRVFKEYTGFAPFQYIQELKMHKAKEILTNTQIPIKEISFKLGYENQDCFFTAFKKKNGMTPTQYRNKTQGL